MITRESDGTLIIPRWLIVLITAIVLASVTVWVAETTRDNALRDQRQSISPRAIDESGLNFWQQEPWLAGGIVFVVVAGLGFTLLAFRTDAENR